MIDSLINRIMPHGDNTHGLTTVGGGKRRPATGSRPSFGSDNGKDVPPCKKRKNTHKWRKKAPPRDTEAKCKAKKGFRAKLEAPFAKPEAPFNSTQFIMDEHDNLNDSDLSSSRPRRHRDSSLSMESEDYLEDEVSSPDDEEEEFMTRQFWCAYEDYHAERLDAMSKSQLVQEYFALEDRLTLLERQLKAAQEQDRRRIREPSPVEDGDEEETIPGEVPVDPETAAKIEIFRSEIQNLEKENGVLRRGHCRRCSGTDNSLSDSDSSLSSDSSSSSGDSEEEAGSSTSQAPSSVPLRTGQGHVVSGEEFELCETTLKGSDDKAGYFAPDSGIASSAASSSGEDAKMEEGARRRHLAFPEDAAAVVRPPSSAPVHELIQPS